MKNISGNWHGNINGTNNADIFIEITQINQNLSAIVRVNDPIYGTSVYRCTGQLKNSKILLKGNPDLAIHNNLEVNLGNITINGILQKSGNITGKWKSSIGTGGTFQVSKVLSTTNESINISNEENTTLNNTNINDQDLELNNKKKDTRKLNPNWDRVELILTLDFYQKSFPNLPNGNNREIIKLSELLIRYHKLINNQITDTLRNPNGVFMKLKNFESLDTRVNLQGLMSASKLDKEIWNTYLNNKQRLSDIARWIQVLINNQNINDLQLISNNDFIEDKLKDFLLGEDTRNTSSIAQGTSDKILDKHTKPVLNIQSVANVFSKYIINYNAEYTSTIIGIFAKWGRGKTFFYKLLKEEIEKKDQNIYFCEFQPWKYQKQESAWAYLYEKILNNYLDNDKLEYSKQVESYESRFRNKFVKGRLLDKSVNFILDFIEPKKTYKIFLLNKERLGIGKFLLGSVSILLLFIWIFLPFEYKFNAMSWIIGVLGITGILFFYKSYNFYIKSKGIVSDLISHYGKTKDYSNYLGFQNEIEKELRHLIKTYVSNDNEQLILFIDDLDRCNEKMIIDIMDSLRLVLEDPQINKKLTIITAVDERILLKSIKHKYFDKKYIDRNNTISSREYIEKFFLVALKLNHLSDKDKIELVREYTSLFNEDDNEEVEDNLLLKIVKKLQNNEALTEHEKAFLKSEKRLKEMVDNNAITIKNDIIKINDNIDDFLEENEVSDFDKDNEKDLKVLSTDEINYIKDLVIQYDIDTPRKINMMIQRYLLFKNFIFEELGENPNLKYEILISLIFAVLEDGKLKELIEKYSKSSNEEIEFEIKESSFKIDRNTYSILLKYAEMVSPF